MLQGLFSQIRDSGSHWSMRRIESCAGVVVMNAVLNNNQLVKQLHGKRLIVLRFSRCSW
jgi:hypothetical protein